MTGPERALLRFLGLWAVVAGVELLERVAYRAGVQDTADDLAGDLADTLEQLDELADELTAFDASDVVAAHLEASAAGAGECVCCLSGATTGPPA